MYVPAFLTAHDRRVDVDGVRGLYLVSVSVRPPYKEHLVSHLYTRGSRDCNESHQLGEVIMTGYARS